MPDLTRFDPPPPPKSTPDPIQFAAGYRCTDKTVVQGLVTRYPAIKNTHIPLETDRPPVMCFTGAVQNKDGLLRGKEVTFSGSSSFANGRNIAQSATLRVGKEVTKGINAHVSATVGNSYGRKYVQGGVGLEMSSKWYIRLGYSTVRSSRNRLIAYFGPLLSLF